MRNKFLFLILVLYFVACKNNILNVEEVQVNGWEPLLALPMVNSSLTIQNLIADADTNIVKVDQDNFITLVYNEKLHSFTAPDVIPLDDKEQDAEIYLTSPEIGTLTGTGSVTFSRTVTIDFDLDGDGVADDIFFNSGDLVVEMNSYLQHDIQVDMIIPVATKNGQPLTETFTMIYNNNVPVNSTGNISLADHLFDFDFNDPAKENKFDILLTITVNYKNNPISTGDVMDIKFGFRNMDLKYFHGYVGSELLDPHTDTLDISFFKNETGTAKFSVADPRIELIVENGFGIPVKMHLNKLEFYDTQTGNIVLSGPGVPADFTINSPSMAQYGMQVLSSLYLDRNNSNIHQIINATPDKFIFSIAAETNPAGNKVNNFVIDDVGMDVSINLTLPLHGTASGFKLQDTLEFEIESPDELLSLMLRANLTNGFPLDLEMQVYLADENHVIIDSLITGDRVIVSSGLVDAVTGKVTTPVNKITDITFSEEKLNKLPQVRYLLVTGVISTFNEGNTDVKIYADYKLDVKIGVLAKVQGEI